MKLFLIFLYFLATALADARAEDPASLFQQGRQALESSANGSVDRAVSLLKRATAQWQAASSTATEYASALDYLAVALMVQLRENAAREENGLADFKEWIKRAGPYTQRALEISESNPAVKPEDLALALELEAQLRGQQGSGAALWERAAKIRAERVAALNAPDLPFGPGGAFTEVAKAGDENTVAPHALSRHRPEYTPIALLAQYSGRVELKAIIGIDGKAHSVQLIRGLGLGLDEEAAKDLLRMRFEPGKKSGEPVSMSTDVQVEFRLK